MDERPVRVQDTANGEPTFHLDHIDTGSTVPSSTDQHDVFFLVQKTTVVTLASSKGRNALLPTVGGVSKGVL